MVQRNTHLDTPDGRARAHTEDQIYLGTPDGSNEHQSGTYPRLSTTLASVLPHITATAYLTALREGGSLPGLLEADDLGTYVVKFTGAGQGPRALVAEIVVGRLGQELGVRVPELALIDVDPEIGRREPDQEVQELVTASAGLNLAMDFLPGSIGYDRSFDVPSPTRPRWSGSTRTWPTSTAADATPTCSSGTGACGRSTTAPACGSTTRGAIRVGSPSPPTTTAITCSAVSVARGTCTTR